jgi:DNA invertase Pin-like site-specific DNA recombinase
MASATAVYCRISDDRLGEGAGVARQEADCRALAERKGWPIAEVYVDNDISAWSGKKRPAYRRLLDDIKDGRVDAVVCWNVDRLHRQPRELEEFIDVCHAAGVSNLASVTGDIDLSTHDGQFTARILGAVSRKASDQASQRIKRKHLELAEKGALSGGGTRPFGFDDDRVTIRPTEAALIRDAAQRVLAGEPLRSVCRAWTDEGVRTVTGANWTAQVMRRLLMSARIAGLREHHGVVVAKATWKPIITEDEHVRLCTIHGDPSRNKRAGYAGRRYLLAGLVRCHLCDAKMVARPTAEKKRRYLCAKGPGFHGCGGTVIMAEPLEEMVTEMLLIALDSPEMTAVLNGAAPDDSDALAEVQAAEAKLAELADQWARDEITTISWQAARRATEKRLVEAKEQLAASQAPRAVSGLGERSLRDEWPTLTHERRQAILSVIIEKVVIGPGRRGYNRFDPDRVDVVWRY